jgi:hypothetical protein
LLPFLDRSRQAGRHLEWKVRVFTLGAAFAVAGIYFDERWMTGAAIVVLVGGVLFRYLPSGRVEDEEA